MFNLKDSKLPHPLLYPQKFSKSKSSGFELISNYCSNLIQTFKFENAEVSNFWLKNTALNNNTKLIGYTIPCTDFTSTFFSAEDFSNPTDLPDDINIPDFKVSDHVEVLASHHIPGPFLTPLLSVRSNSILAPSSNIFAIKLPSKTHSRGSEIPVEVSILLEGWSKAPDSALLPHFIGLLLARLRRDRMAMYF